METIRPVFRCCDIVRGKRGRKAVLYNILKPDSLIGDYQYQVVYPNGDSDVFKGSELSLVKPAIE